MNLLDTARHIEATRAMGTQAWRVAENRISTCGAGHDWS